MLFFEVDLKPFLAFLDLLINEITNNLYVYDSVILRLFCVCNASSISKYLTISTKLGANAPQWKISGWIFVLLFEF